MSRKMSTNTLTLGELNDDFRYKFLTLLLGRQLYSALSLGNLRLSKSVANLPPHEIETLLLRIAGYLPDDRPYPQSSDRDTGRISFGGSIYLWTIEYLSSNLFDLSSNPKDTSITVRVLSVMLKGEFGRDYHRADTLQHNFPKCLTR